MTHPIPPTSPGEGLKPKLKFPKPSKYAPKFASATRHKLSQTRNSKQEARKTKMKLKEASQRQSIQFNYSRLFEPWAGILAYFKDCSSTAHGKQHTTGHGSQSPSPTVFPGSPEINEAAHLSLPLSNAHFLLGATAGKPFREVGVTASRC